MSGGWTHGQGAGGPIVQWHTHTTQPKWRSEVPLMPCGGFAAHRELSVDLMVCRDLLMMN